MKIRYERVWSVYFQNRNLYCLTRFSLVLLPCFFDPFHATDLFPLKTSENHRFSDLFKSCRKKPVTWNRSMLYIDGCPDNCPRGKLTLVKNRVWFRVRVRIRDRGNFPRGSIFLKPYRRILPRKKQPPELFYKKRCFFKISQNSQEKTCARASLLIKLCRLQMFSTEFC